MNGEDVLGSKIRVIYSSQMEFRSPVDSGGTVENPITPRNPRVRELSQTPGGNSHCLIQLQSSPPQGQSPSSWRPTWKNQNRPSGSESFPGSPSSPSTTIIRPPETLKKEVASLLHDVPGASLPLFKFREMFEKRYQRSVSSSDLYRLRDVVAISESPSSSGGYNLGRTISLSQDWKAKVSLIVCYHVCS